MIKKNGSLRLCIDLRPLNDRVVKQKYPFPFIEDCIARLSDKTIFTLLDLKDGFHLIKIHFGHTQYFSFATPNGQFKYKKLPFEYYEAPAEFQKRLIQILQPLIREDKVINNFDDILIPSYTIEENLNTLEQVLLLLKSYQFTLNFDKCEFLKNNIVYLGYKISTEGISINERHVEAVKRFPVPTKVVKLQRFLGLTNYFRKFIQDYAHKAKPLHNLLRKSVNFKFNSDCIQAFNLLKSELSTLPTLKLYNPHLETELHTDASAIALGAILLQKHAGAWASVAYYSQAILMN